MLEVRGREIRLSPFAESTARIRSGATVNLGGEDFHLHSDASNLRINCSNLQSQLKPNDVIYVDDGAVVGIVTEVHETGVKLEIKIGGNIKSGAAVRVTAGKHGNLPLVTKSDIEDLSAMSSVGVIDYLAVPFISTGADIKQVRECLGVYGAGINVLAKIDTIDGVH